MGTDRTSSSSDSAERSELCLNRTVGADGPCGSADLCCGLHCKKKKKNNNNFTRFSQRHAEQQRQCDNHYMRSLPPGPLQNRVVLI